MTTRALSWLDRSALGLSGLCLLHCLAGALALALLATAGGALSHEVHAIGLAVAAPLAALALWQGARRHGRRGAAALGGVGVALMLASLMAGHGHADELVLSVAGVSLLGLAHALNLRWSRG